jgi:hypothetical protein
MMMSQWRQHKPVAGDALHPGTDGDTRASTVHKRKLKLVGERKVPATGFFRGAPACYLHGSDRSGAPKRC